MVTTRKSTKSKTISKTKSAIKESDIQSAPYTKKDDGLITIFQLLFAIVGIYICFLTWGIAQENLTTQPYNDHKFKEFIVLSAAQYVVAGLIGTLYVWFKGVGFDWPSKSTLKLYLQCAVFATIAPHFGFMSLKHIDYLTNILGKSCKLIPVILMKFVLYRQLVEPYKYACILLITLGVTLFMYFDDNKRKSNNPNKGNSLYGIGLLSMNLIIDGITNSTQDQMFKKYKVKGTSMMIILNLFSFLLVSSYLIITPSGRNELSVALPLLFNNRKLINDVLIYCFCGAIGQCFIYFTLEKFGSVTLVTVTVTRKMASILLSVFSFGHLLNNRQWLAVGLVFVGILFEAYMSLNKKKSISDKKKN